MRLLNTRDYSFKEFIGDERPKYTIVSHRWGDDEVTYQEYLDRREDFVNGSCQGYGWLKIAKACEIARERGFEWTWPDTICIDKKSSAELSEAISSMFAWYRASAECHVFLSDVPTLPRKSTPATITGKQQLGRSPDLRHIYGFDMQKFQASQWFTRAWTLQELLAPRKVFFFNAEFTCIGSKTKLARKISHITGVEWITLQTGSLFGHSVGVRMAWASNRKATRAEDIAYSLLGIFGINMPLLYGEGHQAFRRLQKEIIKESEDESIFAWSHQPESRRGVRSAWFARSPNDFGAHGYRPDYELQSYRPPYQITNQGFSIRLWLPPHFIKACETGSQDCLVPLDCARQEHLDKCVPCIQATLYIRSGDHAGWSSGHLRGHRTGLELIRVPQIEGVTPRQGLEAMFETLERDKVVARSAGHADYVEVTAYFPLG